MNFSSILVGASVALMSTAAFADETSLGFPLGEKSRLHTNLNLGVGLDTNPRRRSTLQTPKSGTKLRVSPGIALAVPGSAFNVGLTGGINIDQFFAGDAIEICDGSATCLGYYMNLAVRGGSSNSVLAFELDGGLVGSPTDVFAAPRPSVDPTRTNNTKLLADLGADELRHQMLRFVASPNLVLRPGGGALEFRLGYAPDIQLIDQLGESNKHRGAFEGKLRFLPRTAAVLSADFASWKGTDTSGRTLQATPFNVSLGLRGQLTERLQTDVNVGYADALNQEDIGQQQGVIGKARFRYLLARDMSISLGYNRGIDNVILLGSYMNHKGSLDLGFIVAERLNIEMAASVDKRTFTNKQEDLVIIAGARAAYQFFDFLDANLSYQFMSSTPNSEESDDILGGKGAAVPEYKRQVVMFGLALKY